ncbi:MAG TPA: hypothetical protein VMS92_21705 [Mycobacterium sp.]|nr:hypothetical protein [Mycobacterium sp.]
MARRTVTEVAPAAEPEAPAPTTRNDKGQFQALRGLPVRADEEPSKETLGGENETVVVEKPPGTYKDFLAKAGGPVKAEPAKEEDDADQADDEAEETPAAAEKPPEPAATDVTKYLTKEQRAELATRLDASKAQRAEQRRIQELDTELREAKKQLASGDLDSFLRARGLTREQHLENLLLGRDQQVEQGTTKDPHVAALEAKIAAMEGERAQEKAAIAQQQKQQVDQQAVQRLSTMVTKDTGHVMIARLRQHGVLLQRCEEAMTSDADVNEVAAVEASKLEDQLRAAYPDLYAEWSTAPAPAAEAAPVSAAAALTKKPAVGNRGGKAKESHDPLSLDTDERHEQVKRMFGWKR